MEKFFEVPFYRSLTKHEGWDCDDKNNKTKYHVARAFFKLETRQLPGKAQIGKKFDVMGSPVGVTNDRLLVLETETETFQQTETISKSIVESEVMIKILNELTTSFGDGVMFKFGGQVKSEMSSKIKHQFQNEFKITNSTRKKEKVRYEFRDTVNKECDDQVCGVAVYQRCRADLYLCMVDFLNIEYKRSCFGLRKKVTKYPFPEHTARKHPNIIKIGVPVSTLTYWEALPKSSLLILDEQYVPTVNNDAEIAISAPGNDLKDRPYWSVKKYPTLYQLANVAFPSKWVNKNQENLTKEDLMNIELGEAEHTAWWTTHGPGRK